MRRISLRLKQKTVGSRDDRFLKKQGIYRGHYPKIEAARTIAQHMEVGRNASVSFPAVRAGG